jgi:hypothetical protein
MLRKVRIALAIGFVAIALNKALGQEFAGFAGAELRVFPQSPAFPEQRGSTFSPSLILQPEYRREWNAGKDRLTVVPFLRLDADDDERTHADLRELNWLRVGRDWDLRVGIGKVFWGVAESRHLVDVVNQADLVEDIDEEDKLGQPMVNLNLTRKWGRASLFILPGFRERTFPGREGRLRFALPVDTDRPSFESGAKQRHVDFAARWSQPIGDWDIGVSDFWGTSREPRLIPRISASASPVLIPRYDNIHQTSLEVQATKGNTLWKLEAMTRGGHGNRFGAVVAGFEHTLYGVLGTHADLGILAEYLYDGRGNAAPPTPFDDDLFFGLRLAINDPQSTTMLAGVIVDRHSEASAYQIEASRRLADKWSLELEGRLFTNIPPSDVLFSFSRDDYLQLQVKRFF